MFTRSYETLKKYVYQLEKQQAGFRDTVHDLEANESTSLIRERDHISTDALFIPLLDRELKKICIFYDSQEQELLNEITELERLVQEQEDFGPDVGHQYDRDDYEDDEDDDEDDDDEDEEYDGEDGPPTIGIVAEAGPMPTRPKCGRAQILEESSSKLLATGPSSGLGCSQES